MEPKEFKAGCRYTGVYPYRALINTPFHEQAIDAGILVLFKLEISKDGKTGTVFYPESIGIANGWKFEVESEFGRDFLSCITNAKLDDGSGAEQLLSASERRAESAKRRAKPIDHDFIKRRLRA